MGRVLKFNPQKSTTFGDTVNEKSMVQQLPKPNGSQDSEKCRKSGRFVCNEKEKRRN